MSAQNIMWKMQLERFKIFEALDPESSHFDITFEIDGKLIYANKYVLETISKPFYALLSERWEKKDAFIKHKTYSYDNFYQFLTFVYSGTCELTPKNISTMTDMAEFYDVELFKDFCDEYISKVKYNMDTFFDVMELVTKYTLSKSKAAIDRFAKANFLMILQSDQFMNLKKSSIELFVAFQRYDGIEERLFEAVYKWAENQVVSNNENTEEEKLANIIVAIKAELSGILPNIKFKSMNPGYFAKYVVPKELLTGKELSAVLCEHQKITVTIWDKYRRCLSGSFVDAFNVYYAIDTFSILCYGDSSNWPCYFTLSIPSDLKKNENVQYYFVVAADQCLKVKKPAEVTDDDYLLCEMEGDSNFILDEKCTISVSRN